MTTSWLTIGGRGIDDADSYDIAQGIGAAVLKRGVPRDSVFVVSETGPGGLSYPLYVRYMLTCWLFIGSSITDLVVGTTMNSF